MAAHTRECGQCRFYLFVFFFFFFLFFVFFFPFLFFAVLSCFLALGNSKASCSNASVCLVGLCVMTNAYVVDFLGTDGPMHTPPSVFSRVLICVLGREEVKREEKRRKERKGKERKGKERKGKERREKN